MSTFDDTIYNEQHSRWQRESDAATAAVNTSDGDFGSGMLSALGPYAAQTMSGLAQQLEHERYQQNGPSPEERLVYEQIREEQRAYQERIARQVAEQQYRQDGW
jgi:hypothetical protein